MRLGLSSFCFRFAVASAASPMDVFGMLDASSALGVDLLQICDNLPLHDLTGAELEQLKARADSQGLALEVGTRGLALDHLERYIAIAQTLGSKSLRLVLGTSDQNEAQERLRPVVPLLAQSGLILAIENHFDLHAVQLASVIYALNSDHVKICLDTANSIGILERPLETVSALAHLACQVHLKDYLVEKASIGYHITGRPLGQGWLQTDQVFDLLGSRTADLDYMVELWTDPADSLDETLAKESRWIKQSVDSARLLLGTYIGG